MATIYGTYSCGHEGKVYFPGSTRDNQWRADRHFAGLCPECQAAENAKRIVEIREAHESGENDLPMLEGTEKQILWAESIRERLMKEAWEHFDYSAKVMGMEQHDLDMLEHTIRRIAAITSAGWWIDNRGSVTYAISRYIKAHRDEIEAELVADSPDAEQQKEEANTDHEAAPEAAKTSCVADVKFTDSRVLLYSPKDEIIRKVARDFGMRWNTEAWELKLSPITGSGADRSAELGNKLLNAGVAIKMQDADTLRMAVDGSFQPRIMRWVVYNNDTSVLLKYPGGDDELYKTSKRLPGARWESCSGMVVPATSVDEILDFAESMEFSITEKAKEVLDAALAKKHSRPVVSPAAPKKPKSKEESLREILESSTDVIPDLIDDNE